MGQISPHILLVDDDQRIRQTLTRFLTDNGLRVTCVEDGAAMWNILAVGKFDLLLLDIMLPGADGLSLCRDVRAKQNMPIILMTALSQDTDRIVGLELGADDYICKPFNPRELLARVRAVLRRTRDANTVRKSASPASYRFAGWRLNVANRTLHNSNDELVPLTSGELELLIAFVERPQIVLTRDQLLDLAHGRASVVFDRSIDVQISRLRRKIEQDPQLPTIIKTVRSGGYIFTSKVSKLVESLEQSE